MDDASQNGEDWCVPYVPCSHKRQNNILGIRVFDTVTLHLLV